MPASAATGASKPAIRRESSSSTVGDFKAGGEVVEFNPPRVLAYTWIANWHDNKTRRTLVRWELSPKGKGTLVKVTHSGLADEAVARKDYSGGWPGVVQLLKKHCE